MYINVSQNISNVERINYKIIDFLYDICIKYVDINDYISYTGNLATNYSYQDSCNYLITKYNLLISTLIDNYIRIDPEVLKIYIENNISSDGIGIIASDFDKQINASFFDNFYENENIVDCSSFEYFTNISGSFHSKNGPFYNCTNLKRIILPQPISELNKSWDGAKGVFQGCTSLEYCKITNNTIINLGHYTFNGCTNPDLKIDLKNVPIHNIGKNCLSSTRFKSLETLFLNYDFNNLESLGYCGMSYNTGLESFRLYSNINYIGTAQFAECTNLTSFTVDENGAVLDLMEQLYMGQGVLYFIKLIYRE